MTCFSLVTMPIIPRCQVATHDVARRGPVESRQTIEVLMTPDEFREYRPPADRLDRRLPATIADRPVMAQTEPGEVTAQLPASPPEAPEGFEQVFRDLERIIVPGLSHWQHPSFFGYFPSNASLASVLGDYLSTGLGVLGLSWQSSPALTELEEVVTDWVRQMVGLSDAWSGVIQDTASTSTLVALLCARERTTDFGMSRGGFRPRPRPLVVYTSSQAHSSVDKAALLAGFGRDNVRIVAHDEAYAMRPDALDEAMRRDIAAGKRPCAVVATTGTTTSTAIDPVGAIARVASDARPLAARRCGHGGLGDDPARVPLDVGGHRGGRLAGAQRPQVARRGLRLLALLRQGPGAPGPGDVHQPELPPSRRPTGGSRTSATGASRWAAGSVR